MAKGYKGESCAQAIRNSLQTGEILSYSQLYLLVKKKGAWKNSTIWQHLMALVVSLPPARYHWKNVTPFLFLHGDGRYELYSEDKHPDIIK
jgi:hypothetical protein